MLNQTNLFWEKKEIVEEFSNLPVPPYWKEYFNQFVDPAKIKVLDLGCGGGRNTEMLYEMGYDLSACDLHKSMVEATKRRITALNQNNRMPEIIQANIIELPFDDNTFDVILANGVFHNVSSLDELLKAIGEASRLLKENGTLCINIFTNAKVANDLTKDSEPYLYRTKEGLDLLLLSTIEIVDFLQQVGLYKQSEYVEYERELNVGIRSILRGVFFKKTKI